MKKLLFLLLLLITTLGFSQTGEYYSETRNKNGYKFVALPDNDGDGSSNKMFRQKSNSKVNIEECYPKIRLGFSANGYHRQLLIGFMNQYATSNIDSGYDAIQIDSHPSDIFFLNGNSKLVIQGDTNFNTSSVYPLGIKTSVEGIVKFNIDNLEDFDENQNIYIFDNVTNLYHDIKKKVFEVNLPAGTLNNRFSLRFKDISVLAVNKIDPKENIIILFLRNNMINIKNNTPDVTIKSIVLFNIIGQSLYTWDVKNRVQTNIQIPVINIPNGIYIVKMQTTDGSISKKFIKIDHI